MIIIVDSKALNLSIQQIHFWFLLLKLILSSQMQFSMHSMKDLIEKLTQKTYQYIQFIKNISDFDQNGAEHFVLPSSIS